jgi:hypothetical protein
MRTLEELAEAVEGDFDLLLRVSPEEMMWLRTWTNDDLVKLRALLTDRYQWLTFQYKTPPFRVEVVR